MHLELSLKSCGRLRFSQCLWEAFQSPRAALEKALKPNCFFVGFSSTLGMGRQAGVSEETVEEVVVVHSKESALGDIAQLCH